MSEKAFTIRLEDRRGQRRPTGSVRGVVKAVAQDGRVLSAVVSWAIGEKVTFQFTKYSRDNEAANEAVLAVATFYSLVMEVEFLPALSSGRGYRDEQRAGKSVGYDRLPISNISRISLAGYKEPPLDDYIVDPTRPILSASVFLFYLKNKSIDNEYLNMPHIRWIAEQYARFGVPIADWPAFRTKTQ